MRQRFGENSVTNHGVKAAGFDQIHMRLHQIAQILLEFAQIEDIPACVEAIRIDRAFLRERLASPGRTKNQQTCVGILLELRYSNRILADEFLDCLEREVATLDMNQLGRRIGLAGHRYEIDIRGYHGVAIRLAQSQIVLSSDCLRPTSRTWMMPENSEARRGINRGERFSSRSRLKRD